jgi:hypothetical protein
VKLASFLCQNDVFLEVVARMAVAFGSTCSAFDPARRVWRGDLTSGVMFE